VFDRTSEALVAVSAVAGELLVCDRTWLANPEITATKAKGRQKKFIQYKTRQQSRHGDSQLSKQFFKAYLIVGLPIRSTALPIPPNKQMYHLLDFCRKRENIH
jgi:hypothetical protein